MINKLKYFLLGHFIFKPQINIKKNGLETPMGAFTLTLVD